PAHATEGDAAGHDALHLRIAGYEALEHRRARAAGTDRVDPDALGCVLHRRRPGQAHDAVLARDVGGQAGETDEPGPGRHVHDGPAVFEHGGDLVLQAQEHAGEIQCDRAVPIVERVVGGRRARAGRAGVVESAVEVSPPFDGPVDQRGDVVRSGYV